MHRGGIGLSHFIHKLDDIEARLTTLERKLHEVESPPSSELTSKPTENCGTCAYRHQRSSICIKWDSMVEDDSLVSMPRTLKCQHYT